VNPSPVVESLKQEMLAQFGDSPPSTPPPTHQGDILSDMQDKSVGHVEALIQPKLKSTRGDAQRPPMANEEWRIAKISQTLDELNKSVDGESNCNWEGLAAAIMFEGLTSK